MPSKFGDELDWLTGNFFLAQRLVAYMLLPLAIDVYVNEFVAFSFAQPDFDVDIGSAAVLEAEVRLAVETRAISQTSDGKEYDHL